MSEIVKYNDVAGLRGQIKMSSNPPQCIVDADYCIVFDGKVMQYVGIGWTEVREATARDYDQLPLVHTPHCSQCIHYEILANRTMYCNQLKKRITARKRPCKNYIEK